MSAIFFSYAPQDEAFAAQLRLALSSTPYSSALDRYSAPGGVPLAEYIARSIMACHAVLLIVSPSTGSSVEVVQELNLAENYHRPIIPVIARPAEIPAAIRFHIAGATRIDFSNESFETAFAALLTALDRLPPLAAEAPARQAPAKPASGAPSWSSSGADALPQLAALAALLLGLASPCAWILAPQGGPIICVPLQSILGVALGVWGMRSSRRRMALIGIALSSLNLLVLCLVFVFIGGVLLQNL
jgi:hypothetical protein